MDKSIVENPTTAPQAIRCTCLGEYLQVERVENMVILMRYFNGAPVKSFIDRIKLGLKIMFKQNVCYDDFVMYLPDAKKLGVELLKVAQDLPEDLITGVEEEND